jgi:hypothetical protein
MSQEILKKLIKIANNQQKILEKLAQELPQLPPSTHQTSEQGVAINQQQISNVKKESDSVLMAVQKIFQNYIGHKNPPPMDDVQILFYRIGNLEKQIATFWSWKDRLSPQLINIVRGAEANLQFAKKTLEPMTNSSAAPVLTASKQ